MKEKKCNSCTKTKPIDKFYIRKNGRISSFCKECIKLQRKEYDKTKEGVIVKMYSHQREMSRKRQYDLPTYSVNELKIWCLSKPLFHKLYIDWVNSNYSIWLKPSVDRIDDYKSYTFDNIQLMTFKGNNDKSHNDRKNGINNKMSLAIEGVNLITGKVVNFYSIHEAERVLGIRNECISRACRGIYKTSGNYTWKYKNL